MDTETTGTNPLAGDRIIEVAMVPIYKGKILYRGIYHSLVNPQIRVPATVEKVHGIGNEQLRDAPSMDEVFEKIRSYVSRSIMIFHRAEFDLTFLDFTAKEIGTFLPTVRFLDTYEIAELLFKEKVSLLARKTLRSTNTDAQGLGRCDRHGEDIPENGSRS